MSSSEKYRRKARRQKIPKRDASVSPETTSEPPSKPDAVRSAGAEKKTRGKAARAVARHPDAAPSPASPLSPVSHTRTPRTNKHLSQNTTARSVKNTPKGRRKKTERSDPGPGPGPDPDLSQTEQEKAKTTPSRAQASKRAAKETSPHATLSCPSFQQDTPISSPNHESDVKGRGRGRRLKPRLSSTPQRSRTPLSEPQISPVTVSAHLSSVVLPVVIVVNDSFLL